jgi:hypothetical protein
VIELFIDCHSIIQRNAVFVSAGRKLTPHLKGPRVYPPVAAAAERSDATQRYAPGDAAELALANQRAALAEERLSELKAMLADMQRDRDAWRDQAQRLALPKPDKPMTWWRCVPYAMMVAYASAYPCRAATMQSGSAW